MKKLSKVERVILDMGDHDKYDTYRCEVHGIYQFRKDIPEEKRGCHYCKKQHKKLTEQEIKDLLNPKR